MPNTSPAPASPRHTRIGRGDHSEVLHRHGSRWVLQKFVAETPLTVERLTREYEHLRTVYAAMPDLIGPQRLFLPDADTQPLHQAVLAKRYVEVDHPRAMLQLRPGDLPTAHRTQLAHFLVITRGQLAQPLTGHVPANGVPRLPDIIDPPFRNLAFDVSGRLRLLDTNELISTARLYDLAGTSAALDLERRTIHAKLFARMLLLETLTDRSHDELLDDPLYRSYLTPEQLDTLLPALN